MAIAPACHCTWRLNFLLCAAVAAPATARGETLSYILSPAPSDGRLRVELTWSTSGRTESVLTVQSHWGSVSDVASLIDDVQFDPPDSARREGTRWVVSHPTDATIHCRYKVRAQPEDVNWGHNYEPIVCGDYVHAIGETFLIAPESDGPGGTKYDATVEWKLPAGWRKAVASLGNGRKVTGSFDVHTLRHGVYLAGKLSVVTRTVLDRPVTVA